MGSNPIGGFLCLSSTAPSVRQPFFGLREAGWDWDKTARRLQIQCWPWQSAYVWAFLCLLRATEVSSCPARLTISPAYWAGAKPKRHLLWAKKGPKKSGLLWRSPMPLPRLAALIAENQWSFWWPEEPGEPSQQRRAVPQLLLSDCRTLVEHFKSEIPAKISDKRLGIEKWLRSGSNPIDLFRLNFTF